MSILQFTAPPLPYYIASGFTRFAPGQKHLNRQNIGVFDLLVVTNGSLYIGEGDRQYTVPAGHSLILRPDQHHYPTEECREDTGHFWIHFGTMGGWGSTESAASVPQAEIVGSKSFTMQTFTLLLPQFTRLVNPAAVYENIKLLNDLEMKSHTHWARWKHQLIFQQILEMLNASMDTKAENPAANVADLAASYLRLHYKEDISAQTLGGVLNFHPVYIARCMQREFGCSPFEYLTRYRIEQAKLLLLQTDLTVARVAEEIGFHQPSYFSTAFSKYEGCSPRAYRNRFSGQR